MSSLVAYMGGKNKMSKFIYDNFDLSNIENYVEPFSGSFPIYFNEDFSKVKNIIYNDYNKFMVNLFYCAKDSKTFLNEINKSLESGFLFTEKSNMDDYKKHYRDLYTNTKDPKISDFLDNMNWNIPNYEKAVIYAFMLTSAFNGTYMRNAGYSGVSKNGKLKLHTLINKLNTESYIRKLDKITHFENLSFEKCIERWDGDRTYIYLDPPYFGFSKYYGAEESFPDKAHNQLADILKSTKSKWALSYYWFPELEEWYPREKYRWESKDFFRSSSSFSENRTQKGTELLILNY